ncbi:MAG: hypothetical protein IKH75_00020 [Ruminococcus sp.]|nr:hypothetical protein [Ruminococcus sp.]
MNDDFVVKGPYEDFLTDRDRFLIEFDKYYPEFMDRLMTDRLYQDGFKERTEKLELLAASVGINLESYIRKTAEENGIE